MSYGLSIRRFNVPGQLTATGVVSQDLALVQTPRLLVPVQSIKAPRNFLCFDDHLVEFQLCLSLSQLLETLIRHTVDMPSTQFEL
jgi:hypothetical protein